MQETQKKKVYVTGKHSARDDKQKKKNKGKPVEKIQVDRRMKKDKRALKMADKSKKIGKFRKGHVRKTIHKHRRHRK
jgi:hypothetical protein